MAITRSSLVFFIMPIFFQKESTIRIRITILLNLSSGDELFSYLVNTTLGTVIAKIPMKK